MDKTYNDLMDIVNRTKKIDGVKEGVERPKRMARPRAELEEPEIEETQDQKIKDDVEKLEENTRTSLFAGKDAINKYLNSKKEPAKKSSKQESTTKTKKTTKTTKSTKSKTTKTAKTAKTSTKKKAESETKKTKAQPKSAEVKKLDQKTEVKKIADKLRIIKDKKVVKPIKQAPAIDMSNPRNVELINAIRDTIFAGGTDISEYLHEDPQVTAKSLLDMVNKNKVDKEKDNLNKEQLEYEKLFTGSLLDENAESSDITDDQLQQVLAREQNNDASDSASETFVASEQESAQEGETAGSENTQTTPNADTYKNRFDRDLEEFNSRNNELDQKIADYYKRKQQKIDEYNKSEDEQEEIIEAPKLDDYESQKQAYEDIFGGEMTTRDAVVEQDQEEQVNPEPEQEPVQDTSFRDLYNALNDEDDLDEDRYVTPNSEKGDSEDVIEPREIEEEQKEDLSETEPEHESSYKQTLEDDEMIDNNVEENMPGDAETETNEDYTQSEDVYNLSSDDDLDDYIVSSNIPVETDDNDDSVMYMDKSQLPESKIDVLGEEIKPEINTEDESKDAISKQEFYNEMARLQENLLNELKSKSLEEPVKEPTPVSSNDTLNKALDIISNLTSNQNEMTPETPKYDAHAESVADSLISDIDKDIKIQNAIDDDIQNYHEGDDLDEESELHKLDDEQEIDSPKETQESKEISDIDKDQKVLCDALGIDLNGKSSLLDSDVALNEGDIDYIVESEKTKADKTNYFYLSDEDKKNKQTDEFMSVYDDASGKDVGDLNLNKDIANAIPTEQQVKEDLEKSQAPKRDDMELIYTVFGLQQKPVEAPKEKENIKVLYVASECQPFIATGGLGDVAGSLPKAIAKLDGIDIRVILPLYGQIKAVYGDKLEYIGNFTVHLSWRQEYCGLFRYNLDGVTYYFIDNERYFKRSQPYGYYDDGERFGYFCKAIVESLPMLNFFPDIIHCNDWQSALVSTYIKTGNWSDFRYYKIKNIYTIHNVEYQGIYGMENLKDLFGIDPRFKNDLEYNSDINLTKAAIQFSDKFTTVSDSYCDNLKQPYCSRGLHHIVIRNEYKLSGIINGIDYDFYNPATDSIIYKNYDVDSLEQKVLNKKIWQDELGLPVDGRTPMLAVVSRLVSHKGIDLITKIMEDVLQNDVQLVVVGTGDSRYVDYFKYLENKYPTKVRALVDKYSNEYARKAYAASDIFLMPSKIEPCGISQMIASRYGSIPVVREVGGLRDTIKDFGCAEGGNGYTFANYNPNDLLNQVKRAIQDYRDENGWRAKMRICMTTDFSWQKSAKKYIELYKSLI